MFSEVDDELAVYETIANCKEWDTDINNILPNVWSVFEYYDVDFVRGSLEDLIDDICNEFGEQGNE